MGFSIARAPDIRAGGGDDEVRYNVNAPVYTLELPSGTYFVTPGGLGDQAFYALYESVKANRQAQLIIAGVPMITIAAGQTEVFTFDAQAAHDAIMAVGGDLVGE